MLILSSEKKEKSIVELIISVESEEFEKALNEAFRKNRNRISVPGFRKGKAPRKIIERMFGASIFHSDALDIVLPTVLSFAVTETEVNLVGYPQVTDVNIKEEEGGLEVTVELYSYPEVKLGDYKGVSAVKRVPEVPESEIDFEIESIRVRNARIEKVDRPAQYGDTAVIDYEGFVDGIAFEGGKADNYELVLGSNTFIPGFEAGILDMVTGEQRDIDVVFPETYSEPLAGKAAVFKVTVHELKEQILPEIDDEFAKDVSEFDTLAEYKADISRRLSESKQSEADTAFENALLEKIMEAMEADIPDIMIEDQMNIAVDNFTRQISSYGMDIATYLQMTKTTPEEFRDNIRISSEKQVKSRLALEAIADLEGIVITDEDVENEYTETAQRYNMEVSRLKESVPEDSLREDLKHRLAVKIIVDNAIALEPSDEPESQEVAESPKSEEAAEKPAAKKTSARKSSAKAAASESDSSSGSDPDKEDDSAADKPVTKKRRSAKASTEETVTADSEEPAAEKKTTARRTRKPKADPDSE